jgi:hypothetical protein
MAFQNNTLGQMMDAFDKAGVGQTSKMAIMARLTATLLMPAVAAEWVAQGAPGDKESWYAWMAEAITGELASTVPLVRETWKAVQGQIHRGKVDFGELPVFTVLGNVINIPVDMWKEFRARIVGSSSMPSMRWASSAMSQDSASLATCSSTNVM